ncbi:TM0106 family RecB-like putative nuclease [Candidatus Protochlamydia phocaeensis]|uniref:TM0106 family RecB-like putative nuclease n=1 Tax=Candidatus Protochlamydia phocaeensis TaxID=1414722 RepID=UPI00083925F2|nr:TM0106 family RecB-like putative nuclease [Candidatus Protochlamydia phocaeensis]
MRKYKNHLLLSANDLIAFIECHHKTFLDLQHLGESQPKQEEDEHTRLIRKKGLEHEANYLQWLKDKGCTIIEIPTEASVSLHDREQMTVKAMQSGADYIYQAALHQGCWHGYADLLKRVEHPSQLGSFSYEVIDTKLSKRPEPKHILQLCVYSDLLSHYQGMPPRAFSLVLGNGQTLDFLFKDFAYYYATLKQKFEHHLSSPLTESHPTPCPICTFCDWTKRCEDAWEKADHLSRVANIQNSQIAKLEAHGIRTLEALSYTSAAFSIPNLNQQVFDRLKSQAKLQRIKRESGKNEIEMLPLTDDKGFARLPAPDPGDLFFDMEGTPYATDGLEYLFGFYYFENEKPLFKPFWAHNEEEEKKAFEDVMDFLMGHLSKHPHAHIYHYNHYEDTAIKRLAAKYGTKEDKVDQLLRLGKLVDLYKVVRGAIRVSESSYSIKNLETFYMEKRESDVANAKDSLVYYEQWCELKNEALLEMIGKYNEYDCRSTYLLREWLLSLRPSGLPWFAIKAKEESESQENSAKKVEREQEKQAIQETRLYREKALLEGAHEEDKPLRELTAQLLSFHKRESKPKWWALYDRQTKDSEELIEDTECIAGLTLDTEMPPYKDKRSTVYTYTFPPQEFKLKKGDKCCLVSTLEGSYEIVSLNEEQGKIGLKSKSDALPPFSAITIQPSVNNKKLEEAIGRFADSIIEQTFRYSAIEHFLRRRAPALQNYALHAPLYDGSLTSIAKAVKSLNNSYLFIQGPPGAGKTYTSSTIIIELLRLGKRIGVASNSHKAIHNLLEGIEKAAKKEGLLFFGQKKSDSNKQETWFEGEMIQDIFDNKSLDPQANLLAGTAWLFAEEALDQALDYLFIDEAGQVTLANFIAMGTCAKNIVLIGDQMQLGQPIQGTHPGSSGMSTLEYLLQGESVIAADKGIFLDTTWRMHDKVCRFISDAVYEGRLQAQNKNQTQSLILSQTAHPSLVANGIKFIPIEHTGRSQKSEEEGALIREIISDLLKQNYRCREGNVRPLTLENILVITPYNIQLNYLKTILPQGTRVGTVDKFQGQEAEVVLFSMVTSGADELPRDIEFLFSKNRLNVAISRARTLALIIANPRLLEIPCSTVDQIRLVNTLCWAREYAS